MSRKPKRLGKLGRPLSERKGYVCALELKSGGPSSHPFDHRNELDDWFVVTICSDPGHHCEDEQDFYLFRRSNTQERETEVKSVPQPEGDTLTLYTYGSDETLPKYTHRVRMQEVELAMVDTLREALLHKRQVTVFYEHHNFDHLMGVKLHA